MATMLQEVDELTDQILDKQIGKKAENFRKARVKEVNAAMESDKEVFETWHLMAKVIKEEVLERQYFRVMRERFGLAKPEAMKRYFAHLLWKNRLIEDVKPFADVTAFRMTAYWSIILDNKPIGWNGELEELIIGRKAVDHYLSWSRSQFLNNASYPEGKFCSFASFRHVAESRKMAAAAKAKLDGEKSTPKSRFALVNTCPRKGKLKPVDRMSVNIVDPTNSLSRAQVRKQLRHMVESDCFDIAKLK